MKAVVCIKYGVPENLQIMEVENPVPGEREILIRVKAATVTAGDCEIRKFKMAWWIWLPMRLFMGLFKPRVNIYGQEFSGMVEEVGDAVTEYQKGDEVFGPTDMYLGAYGEYKVMKADATMLKKPATIGFDEAATIPTGGLNALYFLQKAGVKKGQKILINGAGGCIGTYGIQLAKYFGAEVTAVDSTNKLEMLKEAGADYVIDYTKENYTLREEKYDIIFDAWSKGGFSRSLTSLVPGGKLVIANPAPSLLFLIPWLKIFSSKRVISGIAPYHKKDLEYMAELMQEGKIRAIIDREYSMDDIVEAHRYVDEGGKKGHLIIKVA